MKNVSRRDLLKSSLLVPAAAVAHGMTPMASAMQAAAEHADPHPAGADLGEGHPRPRRHERGVVGVAAEGRRAGACLRAGEHGGPTPSG